MFRAFLVLCGLYLPVFFLQLDAIKHGIDPKLAFYTVRTGLPSRLKALMSF
jgi:hypothetical protein